MEGPVLEVGSRYNGRSGNPRILFSKDTDYVGIDMQEGVGVDVVHDMEQPYMSDEFQTVICCSVLEHCARPWLVANNIEAALRRDGNIFVSAPFVWRFHNYPNDYWRFSTEAFKVLFPQIEWEFLYYIGKKKKEIFSSYFELSSSAKAHRATDATATAMSVGFGRKR